MRAVNLNTVKGVLKTVGMLADKNAPTLMAVAAVGGVIALGVLAFKAEPKAKKVTEAAREEKDRLLKEKEAKEQEEGANLEEVEKAYKAGVRHAKIDALIGYAKCLWPVFLCGGLTIALIIAGNRISVKRLAVMTGAYEVVSGDLKKYKEKALEIAGEKKVAEIDKQLAEEKMAENCDHNGHPMVVYSNGTGDQLYYDWWSGNFFRSREAHIERVFKHASEDVTLSHFSPLNAYIYPELGLPCAGCGENYGLIDFTDPKYESSWAETPGGDKAIVLKYPVHPMPKYGDM